MLVVYTTLVRLTDEWLRILKYWLIHPRRRRRRRRRRRKEEEEEEEEERRRRKKIDRSILFFFFSRREDEMRWLFFLYLCRLIKLSSSTFVVYNHTHYLYIGKK